jgi:hypothetical protein
MPDLPRVAYDFLIIFIYPDHTITNNPTKGEITIVIGRATINEGNDALSQINTISTTNPGSLE